MVKKAIAKVDKISKTQKKHFESQIKENFCELSESNLENAIRLLLKYQELNKCCKNIKSAYTILFVSFFIFEQNPTKENLEKNKVICKDVLSEIFNMHCKGQSLNPKCCHFKLAQSILNLSTPLVASNPEILQTNLKLLYFIQILKMFKNLSFKASMQALQQVLGNNCQSSIFSLFTSKVVPFLPEKQKYPFTIVLDLDETLGYFEGKKFVPRPYVDNFLDLLSKKYEVILFTSALESYANYAMSIVDRFTVVTLRLYRQHLHIEEGRVYKDLSWLGRDLDKVIIIDNEPKNFSLQPSNGIHIVTWKGEQEDKELMKLMRFFGELQPEGRTAYDIVEEINKANL